MNTDKHRFRNFRIRYILLRNFLSLFVLICVNLWLIFLSSCSTKPTDMRTLVPAETLVYLETNDLAAALQPIVDAKPFMEVAKSKPDFSALKGVQLAVAVTGFETSEEKLTDEHSVGRVQPRFVAVADTHAWNSNAVAFAEKKLGSFVANIYDSEPTVEKTDKNGGKYFTWTATDGRKAFALVIDSLIYFGNDESAIEKCLAVKRGETDSILTTGKIPVPDPTTLAQGYVSTDGIAQIAALVGLKFASEAADESEVQSAIAGILPQLIRNSITEISWTSTKTEKGIEDRYTVGMPHEVASVFNETMTASDVFDEEILAYTPADPEAITLYNLRNPQVAWRSLVLTANKGNSPLSGRIINLLAIGMFSQFGIDDPELFFGATGSSIAVVRYKEDDEAAVVSRTTDAAKTSRSLSPDARKTFQSTDAVFVGGDEKTVRECRVVKESGKNLKYSGRRPKDLSMSPALTLGNDFETAPLLADFFSVGNADAARPHSSYITETRFTKTGIDRRTTSDFGLIGSIIAQLGGDE